MNEVQVVHYLSNLDKRKEEMEKEQDKADRVCTPKLQGVLTPLQNSYVLAGGLIVSPKVGFEKRP